MSLKPLLLLSMSRILTGIQSTGTPHLGNILGAIIPAIEESKKNTESFLFIADLHSLTQIKNPDELSENTYSCLLYTSPSPRDVCSSRMPSSA